MKRTLAVIAALTLTATAHAQTVIGYMTGTWRETKVPVGLAKMSGEIDIYIFDDYHVEADYLFNGDVVNTATGQWSYSNVIETKVAMRLTFSNPTVYNLNLIGKEGFPLYDWWQVTGTFRSQSGDFIGKIQASTLPDGSKSLVRKTAKQ